MEPVGMPSMAQGGHAYFSNSFYVPEIPATWRGALGTHGVSSAFALLFRGLSRVCVGSLKLRTSESLIFDIF